MGTFAIVCVIVFVVSTAVQCLAAVTASRKPTNPEVICPHCQVKGKVIVTTTMEKSGVSGGKATAAILTGGLSLPVAGLSKKTTVTKMHCKNCQVTWTA